MEVGEHFSDRAKADVVLIKAAKNGDQSAYTSLMLRYRESIYYLILKMVKSDLDAEDLAIESFEKAFSNLHQYQPTYGFSTWLYRIATNHSIDFIRKKKLSTVSINRSKSDGTENTYKIEVRETSKDPEMLFIEKQKIDIVQEMVEKLNEPYQSLVRLRYLQEYSYDEIAMEKDIPLGTVKAQLFRARALLADLIRKSKNAI